MMNARMAGDRVVADVVKRIYAGIGSRDTPSEVLDLMTQLAGRLEQDGWLLRTGDAYGADRAFMNGVQNPKNRSVYLPGEYSRGLRAGDTGIFNSKSLPSWPQAQQLARRYHGNYDNLTPFVKDLMARSSHQVLGPNLNRPADLIVAWTPGGRITRGTGQALRIALDQGIQVRNLGDPAVLESVMSYLGSGARDRAMSQGQTQSSPKGAPMYAMPMKFAYGANAVPGTEPTTFDAILAGQRTSTLRKIGQIPEYVQPGSLVTVYDDRGRRQVVEVTGRRIVDPSMVDELSQTERWTPEFLANYINRVGGGKLEQLLYRMPNGAQ